MSAFDDVTGMEPLRIWEGVAARAVEGEGLALAIVELDPESHVPEHRHPNEQLGFVISGLMRFRVGDETRDLRPGETWRIPKDVPHEAWAGPEGAVVLDAFAPPRADWAAIERDPPRAPRWPA